MQTPAEVWYREWQSKKLSPAKLIAQAPALAGTKQGAAFLPPSQSPVKGLVIYRKTQGLARTIFKGAGLHHQADNWQLGCLPELMPKTDWTMETEQRWSPSRWATGTCGGEAGTARPATVLWLDREVSLQGCQTSPCPSTAIIPVFNSGHLK